MLTKKNNPSERAEEKGNSRNYGNEFGLRLT
jgi:hypothetical protein